MYDDVNRNIEHITLGSSFPSYFRDNQRQDLDRRRQLGQTCQAEGEHAQPPRPGKSKRDGPMARSGRSDVTRPSAPGGDTTNEHLR